MGKLPFERIERQTIVLKEAQPDKFGIYPKDRSIGELLVSGIVNIDKPQGPTSHQVSAYAQKILGINKGGHSGTLDPNVSGVLPIAIGRGTRVVQALLPAGKEYVCLMHLHQEVAEERVREVMESFIGRIKQMPPIKSAIKRQLRYRKIYYMDIHEVDKQDVLFTVGCQAGTYIRKLCHDIGEKLGVGAHMQELRRTKAGPFQEQSTHTLQDLTDAMHYYKNEGNDSFIRNMVLPIEEGVKHLKKVVLLDTTVNAICHGANLAVPGIATIENEIEESELVAIMTLKGELVAIGRAKMTSKDMEKEEHGIAVALEAVFMDPGLYPKIMKK